MPDTEDESSDAPEEAPPEQEDLPEFDAVDPLKRDPKTMPGADPAPPPVPPE